MKLTSEMTTAYLERLQNPVVHVMLILNFGLAMFAIVSIIGFHASSFNPATAPVLKYAPGLITALLVFDLVVKPAITVAYDAYRGGFDV